MLMARDDVVLTLTEDDEDLAGPGGAPSQRTLARRRKYALVAHFIARVPALIMYMFCSWITNAFIVPVILIVTCFALDFWLVKNVSGRLLVGLRWWNNVDASTGKSHWLFESANSPSSASNGNASGGAFGGVAPVTRRELAHKRAEAYARRLFWIGLFVFPLIWSIYFLIAVFSFKLIWAMVALCGCVMCSINLYGYLRCRFRSTNGSDGDSTSNFTGGDSMLGLLRAGVAKSLISDLWSDRDAAVGGPAVPSSTDFGVPKSQNIST